MVSGGGREETFKEKIITTNILPPPLSYIHVPFEVLRVIINDAFCEPAPRQQSTVPRGLGVRMQ